MLIIIKWRPSSILSKIGAVLLDLSLFNGAFVPHRVYIHEVTGSQHQSIWRHNQCFTYSLVLIYFLSIKLAEVCTLRVLSSWHKFCGCTFSLNYHWEYMEYKSRVKKKLVSIPCMNSTIKCSNTSFGNYFAFNLELNG